MKFIDIHSHLESCKNIPQIVKSCDEKEVVVVTCGTDIDSNRQTLELKKKYPQIEICLGIYPLESLKLSDKEIEKEIDFIRKNKDKILGIGEVGLDLHSVKDEKNFEKQKRTLSRFVQLSKEIGKPIVVHSRDAEKETVELLESFDYSKVLMHCFSGNMKLVKRIIDNGWKLSIPASVKYNQHFQKILEISPIENLFCETDSPFLHPDRKQDNNSANVIESYKKIAELKEINLKNVEKQIWKNYLGFFGF
jgi:TatD DNase family protein